MNKITDSFKRRVTLWPKKLPVDQVQQLEAPVDNAPKTDAEIVSGLVKKSNRILVNISTHRLPIDIFPDTLNVEEGRLTVIIRDFFFSCQVHSVDIKDISNIFIHTSPFFAQLVIVSKTFTENEIRIKGLWRKEAVFARRIVEGLRIFNANEIDTSVYTKLELINKLKELSKTAIVV